MLDRINNNSSEPIDKNIQTEKIKELGVTNPFREKNNAYFIDESDISSVALEKYQRELDVKKFSEILLNQDEKEAIELVLKNAFSGTLSIDNKEILSKITDSVLNELSKKQ